MQTKHTPGPWINNNHMWLDAADGTHLFEVAECPGLGYEAEGNWRLLAAAPDLLAALELTVATITRLYPTANKGFSSVTGTLDIARAAIAKATSKE